MENVEKQKKAKLVITFGKESGKEFLLNKDTFVIGKAKECDLCLDVKLMADREASIDKKGNVFILRSLTGSEISVSGEKIQEKILENSDVITIGNIELTFSVEAVGGFGELFKQRLTPREVLLFLIATGLLVAAIMLAGDFFLAEEKKRLIAKTEKEFKIQEDDKKVLKRRRVSEEEMIHLIADARKRIEIADSFYSQVSTDESYYFKTITELQAVLELFYNISPEPPVCAQVREKIAKTDAAMRSAIHNLKNNAYVAHERGDADDLNYILQKIMLMIPLPTDQDYIWAKKKYLELVIGEGKGKK